MISEYTYSYPNLTQKHYRVNHKDREDNEEHKRGKERNPNIVAKNSTYAQNNSNVSIEKNSQLDKDIAKLVGLGINLNIIA